MLRVVILFITCLFFHRKYSYLNVQTSSIMFCTFCFCFRKRRWLVRVGKLFAFGLKGLFSSLSAYIRFDLPFSTLLFNFLKFFKLDAEYPFFRQCLRKCIRYIRLRLDYGCKLRVNGNNIRKHNTPFITVTNTTSTKLLLYRRRLNFGTKRENRICRISITRQVLSKNYLTTRLSLRLG